MYPGAHPAVLSPLSSSSAYSYNFTLACLFSSVHGGRRKSTDVISKIVKQSSEGELVAAAVALEQ